MAYESADRELYKALRELAEIELHAVSLQPPASRHRPNMAGVQTDEHGSDTRVTVRLTLGPRGFTGDARAPSNIPAINRAAAEATLRALDELALKGYALARVDWVEVLEPPGPELPRVMHVAVLFRTVKREDLLVGSSVIRGVEYEASVRATLDAVNRQVALVLQAKEEPRIKG